MASNVLQQPWKNWYEPEKNLDYSVWNPLANAVCLSGGSQGAMPQKPREVDLSQPKARFVQAEEGSK